MKNCCPCSRVPRAIVSTVDGSMCSCSNKIYFGCGTWLHFRCDFRFATTLPSLMWAADFITFLSDLFLDGIQQNVQVASNVCVRLWLYNWHGKTEEPVYLLHTSFGLNEKVWKNINLDFCTHQNCHHQHQTQSVYFPVRDIIVSSATCYRHATADV